MVTAILKLMRIQQWSRAKIIMLSIATLCVAGSGILAYRAIITRSTNAPNYATILPDGKSIAQLGGWKRVSPPNKDPVFAYLDTIDGVAISVSEQPLPKSFLNDPAGQTAELAKNYNATDKVMSGATAVYIGTNIKGPQSVVLTKDNVLVLIKSAGKIEDISWTNYVALLH